MENTLQITDIKSNGERLTENATIWLCQGKIVIGGIVEGNAEGFGSVDSAKAFINSEWPEMPIVLHASLGGAAA